MNIIAYGSLLKKSSLERSMQRPMTLIKVLVPGYERVFNARFGEYSYLNIRKNRKSTIEAGFFTLNKTELEKFAERESGSDLIGCLPGFFAFVWPKKDCAILPVLQSYVDVCEEGAKELGILLWRGTIKPSNIIDDREEPLYFA